MSDYDAIVRILDADQQPVGAGCLVRERLIVTCAHVVAEALDLPRDAAEVPAAPISLDFPFVASTTATARVVLWWPYRQTIGDDRRHDLAILELQDALPNVDPARLLKVGQERPGPIHVYGFPEGAGLGAVGDWIEGRVTPPLPNGWLKLVQRDQQARFIEPGCSGGPVIVDETGLVAGIVSLRRSGSGPPEAYGISAALIREALNESSVTAAGAGVDVPQEEPAEEVRPAPPEPAGEPALADEAPPTNAGAAKGRTAQPRIFLAHASEDKPRVRQLYEDLKDRGFEPWLDEVDLIPGQVWREEIPKAIRGAGLFLACLSSRSAAKQGYVQSEFRTALTTFGERPPGSIWLIPVKLDDCEIPDLQIPDRGISLRDIHWLDLGREKGFEQLVRAIELVLPKAVSAPAKSEGRSPSSPLRGEGPAAGVIDVSDLRDTIASNGRHQGASSTASEGTKQSGGGGGHATARWYGRNRDPVRGPAERGALRPRHWQVGLVIAGVALLGGVLAVLDPFGIFEQEIALPEMVKVPDGSFMRGSPEDEEGRLDSEGPQREVRIAERFAIGKYEVTFDEWDACVEDGGCNGHKPTAPWGRGQQPVINVSWNDAQAYVSWLTERTGEAYRLPSEAEWEYAARAGTTTRYSWGDDITPNHANYGHNVGGTTEVGDYPPNPWGLHDMHGNVWEWVEDCWNDSYEGAPEDGSAWTTGNCSRRVVRGGSWDVGPDVLRSADRVWSDPVYRDDVLGFRVARTLTP